VIDRMLIGRELFKSEPPSALVRSAAKSCMALHTASQRKIPCSGVDSSRTCSIRNRSCSSFRWFPASFNMIRADLVCWFRPRGGGGLRCDCNHRPYEHRIARRPVERTAYRGISPEIRPAGTILCPSAGRCVARPVDTPDVTTSFSICAALAQPEPSVGKKSYHANPRLICVKMMNFTCSNLAQEVGPVPPEIQSGDFAWHAISLGL
jgi:hypothetical protein